MSAGLLVLLVAFWKEWGTLALVLMSFWLQVILLITAEIRRRKDSGVLKVVVWSAYLLADTTAIYVLGHMSVTCTTSPERQLQAFWAPFLLLHLGGQDNITAYSIEDNRLWLRHLQSFVVQLLAAAYILSQSPIVARQTLLLPAAILVFVAGFVKYGERVCALKLACSDSTLAGKNYQSYFSSYLTNTDSLIRAHSEVRYWPTFRAHALLSWAKKLLKGPSSAGVVPIHLDMETEWEEMYRVTEVQLSLMHDVFYSKSLLIQTWHGYCIRVFSLLATVVALNLFRVFSDEDRHRYRKVDVSATYALFHGAIGLEIISLWMAVCSTWASSKIISERPSPGTFRVACALACLSVGKCCVRAKHLSASYWSASMGQHNFVYMCSNCKDGRGTKIARWMGWEDWWNMLVYTSSVPVSREIIQLLKRQMTKGLRFHGDNPDHIHNSRGRAALKRMPGLFEELGWFMGTDRFELDETILVWHIATHVYLSYKEQHTHGPTCFTIVTRELSDYMMFLLAARPDMLCDSASRQGYVQLCHDVMNCHREFRSEADLLGLMRRYGEAMNDPQGPSNEWNDIFQGNITLGTACKLGSQLIEQQPRYWNLLEVITEVWMELLCYVAFRCRPDSHARQLSNGGEFTTIVALMLNYAKNGILLFNQPPE